MKKGGLVSGAEAHGKTGPVAGDADDTECEGRTARRIPDRANCDRAGNQR